MSEVKDIVAVNITRETRYPTQLGFGSGAIISEFTPGSLNNPMLGGDRYQLYTSTAAMTEDGWAITDVEYRAAAAYFNQNPNPGIFMVGRKDTGDADWTETLTAIQVVYTNWYGFTVNSITEADVLEAAAWAETQVKLFGYTSSQLAIIGIEVLLTSGHFTSGAPGTLAMWQALTDGEFLVSKDGAAVVEVDGINMSAAATAGNFVTGLVTGKMAAFQAVSDGEFSIAVDGAAASDVASVDFSGASTFAQLAAILETDIQALGGGFVAVTVVYDSDAGRFVITSDSTGGSSNIVIAIAAAPSGTDLTLSAYFDGGDSTPGTAASLVADMDEVAADLQAAIIAAGVAGITVIHTDNRLVFTSGTTGDSSSMEITTVVSGAGTDLTGTNYINGGIVTLGTDAGPIPGTGDYASLLKALAYDHSIVVYNENAQDKNGIVSGTEEFSFIAWLGEALPYDPASQTWAFKTLKAITVSSIGSGQEIFAKNNNANVYVNTGGVAITLDGKVISGEYIDIIRGTHWLEAEMQTAVFASLLNNRKVPFTDAGITLVENAIRGVMSRAEVNLLNAEDTVITIPKRVDTDPTDRAARFLDGVLFNSSYQGAIQKVAITGTLSV